MLGRRRGCDPNHGRTGTCGDTDDPPSGGAGNLAWRSAAGPRRRPVPRAGPLRLKLDGAHAVAYPMLAERLDAIAAEDLVVHHGCAGAEHLVVGRSGVFLVDADRCALQAVREALDARGLVALPAEIVRDHARLERTVGGDRRFGLRVVTRACAALGVPGGVPFVAAVAEPALEDQLEPRLEGVGHRVA